MSSIGPVFFWLFMSQAVNDPLIKAAEDAVGRLKAEERKYDLGASIIADVTLRRQEWLQARRAVATRDGSAQEIGAIFEEEIQLASRQLESEQRRFDLGAASDRSVAEQRRNLVALRRNQAEWKSKTSIVLPEERAAAGRQARALLEEEIGVAEQQLRIEERLMELGALHPADVAKRRQDVAALRSRLI